MNELTMPLLTIPPTESPIKRGSVYYIVIIVVKGKGNGHHYCAPTCGLVGDCQMLFLLRS